MCVLYLIHNRPSPVVGLEKLGLFLTIGAIIWSVYIHAVSALPHHHEVGRLLRNSAGGFELWGYISSFGQFILNLLSSLIIILTHNSISSLIFSLTYNSLSKGQNLSYIHLILHSQTISMTYSMFPPYLGGGVGEILRRPCLPPLSRGVGLGCGWLGPLLSFILANA
jgi:hypothetical protein